jgi:hypothetical protein
MALATVPMLEDLNARKRVPALLANYQKAKTLEMTGRDVNPVQTHIKEDAILSKDLVHIATSRVQKLKLCGAMNAVQTQNHTLTRMVHVISNMHLVHLE